MSDAASGGAPLRVCVVGPSLHILGGQAVQAQRLMDGLRGIPGLEVDLLPIDPRLPGVLGWLQRFRYVRTVLTEIGYVASLLRRLRGYDVIHVFSASYFSFLLAPTPAILLARALGRPVLLNYHSGEAEDHLERWHRTAPRTIRLADAVVVPSGYLVDVFARHGIEASAIFNVVDMERFRFRERAVPQARFLSNRNLERHYGVASILRAFAIIQAALPEASLTVAGDGRERRGLEDLAAALGLRHVTFLGKVPPERMPDLYRGADIYLNGSQIDNMPLSILEAFAAGTPVVTTDAGGIPYIVEHGKTGLMVPVGDHGAMAEAALRLVREPSLAGTLAEQARRYCREHCVWEVVAGAWVRMYASLAGRSPEGWSGAPAHPASAATAPHG